MLRLVTPHNPWILASLAVAPALTTALTGREPIWHRDLGDKCTRLGFGEGSSPLLAGGRLVVIWDHEGDSFLVALDAATGVRGRCATPTVRLPLTRTITKTKQIQYRTRTAQEGASKDQHPQQNPTEGARTVAFSGVDCGRKEAGSAAERRYGPALISGR